MPPDIIASLASPSGSASLGSQLGKTANGPPGIDPDHALFASLLAQKSTSPGTLPQTALAAARGKSSVPLPSAVFSQKTVISQKKLGNTKTMDTDPVRSPLPKEKNAAEGELLLPQTQVDVPAVPSQLPIAQLPIAQLPIAQQSVLPFSVLANNLRGASLPSTLLHAPALKTPALRTADITVPLSHAASASPERLTRTAHATVPVQNTCPGSPVTVAASGLALPLVPALSLPLAVAPGLDLPRTFAVVPSAGQIGPVLLRSPAPSALAPVSDGTAAPLKASAKSVSVGTAPVSIVFGAPVLKVTATLPAVLALGELEITDTKVPVDQPVTIIVAALGKKLPDAKLSDAKLPETNSQNSLKSAVFPADNQTVNNTDRTNTRVTEGNKAVIGKAHSKDESVSVPVSKRSAGQEVKDAAPAVSAGTSAATLATVSATTDAVPLTATERAAVVKQAAEGVSLLPLPKTPGGTEQITLQLHPKDWGSLHISLTLAPSGEAGAAKTVTAHIIADTPQVKAALEGQSGELHQTLRAAGLHLEHLTVSVRPETVSSASDTSQTGTSTGNGQSQDAGSRGFGQTFSDQRSPDQKLPEQRQFDLASGSPNNGGAFAAFTGGNQQGRQEHSSAQVPTGTAPLADLETASMPTGQHISHPGMGRIDTHA